MNIDLGTSLGMIQMHQSTPDKDSKRTIRAIIRAMRTIQYPRYYETERGYQAELYCALKKEFKKTFPSGTIPESEYQKNQETHSMSQRPDIIFHIPAEFSGLCVNEGNSLVIALKLNANKGEAVEDFKKMDDMFERLNYPVGIFINIGSFDTYLECYEGAYKNRMIAFGVKLLGNFANIKHDSFNGEKIISTIH